MCILAGALLSPPCTGYAARGDFDVAVVLGAGMAPGGRLYRSSLDRIAAGVALYESGGARSLHMTGGITRNGGPSAGAQMARAAISMGVPAQAITHEGASYSTLQNALFSKPMLAGRGGFVLVTEGLHLSRSYLSFWWAGIRPASLCHSSRFRVPDPDTRMGAVGMLVREVLAFWFNAARASAWSVATLAGAQGPGLDAILE
ncbi:Integral membrane protein [Candidatus Rhodobacter oscarellae]|uniref:Integral membrane protein n=1 Tax=Candidatus Rhodobacter oscarellae TaxID=1675527 RepID=A0A0J9E288_9RHOB|nr:YdcF family protein [Candidatus Rhodobacter lobularis]KMW56845.1 Integral membrane protein [Candidatus Rhodobacter lobularis]